MSTSPNVSGLTSLQADPGEIEQARPRAAERIDQGADMAQARPPTPSADALVGPLITSPSTAPTVSIVMSTRPEAHLRSGDRRRLTRAVSGAERRLARTSLPSADRGRLMQRLWDLAAHASRGPSRRGVALIAGPHAGRVLTLEHPVTDRILLGPPPTYEELVEQSWGFARIAVLVITGRGPLMSPPPP